MEYYYRDINDLVVKIPDRIIKYISTVLNAYKQNNIKTVQQAQEHEARRGKSFEQPKKKDYRDVLDEWLAEKQAEDERRLANDLSRSY